MRRCLVLCAVFTLFVNPDCAQCDLGLYSALREFANELNEELSNYPDFAIQHTPMEVLAMQVFEPVEGEDDFSEEYYHRIVIWFVDDRDDLESQQHRLVSVEVVSMDDFDAIGQSGTLMHAAIPLPDHYDPDWTLTLQRVQSDTQQKIVLRALVLATGDNSGEEDAVYSVSRTFEYQDGELVESGSELDQVLR